MVRNNFIWISGYMRGVRRYGKKDSPYSRMAGDYNGHCAANTRHDRESIIAGNSFVCASRGAVLDAQFCH